MKIKMDGWMSQDQLSYTKIEELIQPCMREDNPWWKSLKRFGTPQGEYSNKITDIMHDFFLRKRHNTSQEMPHTTIKTCPGLIDLFKCSYIVKWPHDIIIHTGHDGYVESYAPSQNPSVSLAVHNQWQRSSASHTIMDGYINIKVNTPVRLKSSEITKWVFTIPAYHARDQIPYATAPGILTLYKNRFEQLNINLMFEQKDATYHFKCGDPLCYLTSPQASSISPVKIVDDKIFDKHRPPEKKYFGSNELRVRKCGYND